MKINRIYLSFIITCFIMLLTVGFSSFQQELFIDKVGVSVRLHDDIRITGISVDSAYNGGMSKYEEYNVHHIFSGIYLPNKDSTVTYKIEMTNFGNIEKGVFDIWISPNNLTYELHEYDYKQKVCDEDKCTLGAKKDVYIVIKYQVNGFNKNNLYYDFYLDFDFRKYYKISYNNFKSIDSEYPLEVMDGDGLYIIFKDDIPSKLSITMDGKPYTNFDRWNNTLSISEVTGDVIITKID